MTPAEAVGVEIARRFVEWDGFSAHEWDEWRWRCIHTGDVHMGPSLAGRPGAYCRAAWALDFSHPATIGALEAWALELGCSIERGRGADWAVYGVWDGSDEPVYGPFDLPSSWAHPSWAHRVRRPDGVSQISYGTALCLAIREATP